LPRGIHFPTSGRRARAKPIANPDDAAHLDEVVGRNGIRAERYNDLRLAELQTDGLSQSPTG
jgi:hypothetical protein